MTTKPPDRHKVILAWVVVIGVLLLLVGRDVLIVEHGAAGHAHSAGLATGHHARA